MVLRGCAGPVAQEIVALGVAGLTVNVRDDAVRASLMTLTSLDPPVVAVVSMWVQQCYGQQVREAIALLSGQCQVTSPRISSRSQCR